MAKAKVQKSTKQKTNANSAPTKKTSKIQKPNQAAPASQGLRRSGRETRPSSRAQEAVVSAPPPTQKSKIGARNEKTADPPNNADAEHLVDPNTNAPPPTKKLKTGPTTKPTERAHKVSKKAQFDQVIRNAMKMHETRGKSTPLGAIAEDADAALTGSPSIDDQSNNNERPSKPMKTRSGREISQPDKAQELVANAPPPTRKLRSGPIKRKTGPDSKNARTGSSKDTTRDTDAQNPARKAKTGPKDAIPGVSSKDIYIDLSDDTDIAENALPPVKKNAKTNSYESSSRGTSNNADADSLNQDTDVGAPVAYSGREATRERLHQEGWISEEFPEGFRRCYVPDCRLPSPFVPSLGDRHEELQGAVDAHVHDGVRCVWERAHISRDRIRTEMLEGNAISDDGQHGRFYALAPVGVSGTNNGTNHEGFQSVICGGDDAPFLIALDFLKCDRTATTDTGKTLDVQRLFNTQSGEVGYFVVNPDLKFLAVNESAVSPNLIAGPLPDFAVISIEEVALFWFRTRQALEGYLPEPRVSAGTKRKRDDARPTVTWETILNDGLQESRRSYRESLKHDDRRTGLQITDAANMTIDEIWVAIGSFWEGLRSGTPRTSLDAYAGIDVFYPPGTYDYPSDPKPTAGWGKRFFMPIIFAADKDTIVQAPKAPSRRFPATKDIKGKGKAAPVEEEEQGEEEEEDEVGHLLLAVAQIVGEPEEIQLHIYDSSEKEAGISHGHVLRRARDLIKRAKWPNPNIETTLKYRNTIYDKVPQQQVKTNTCGLYTILNAWALMLGIPVQHQHLWRPERSAHERFVRIGLEIVNLALVGFMNSRTVQAFMNVHGYSQKQNPINIEERAIPVDATAMQQTRLERKLQSQRRVDLGISEGRSASPDERAPRGSPVETIDTDITTLMSMIEATREDAVNALRRSGGDLGAAAGLMVADLPIAEVDGSAQLEGSQSSGLSSPGQSESSDQGVSSSGQFGSSQNPGPSSSAQPGSFQNPGLSSSGQPGNSQNSGSNRGTAHVANIISFASAGAPWAWVKKGGAPSPGLDLSD